MDNPTTGNTGFSGYPKKAKKKRFLPDTNEYPDPSW
jgi:hypothetical protein